MATLKINVSTKWHGCSEDLVISLDDLGCSEQEWDNMSEEEREEEIVQLAYDAIGFYYSYDYVD